MQLERNAKLFASTGEKLWVPPQHEIRPFPLQLLESNPEFPIENQKEAGLPLWNSQGSPKYPSQLKWNPEYPATTREETCFPQLISN